MSKSKGELYPHCAQILQFFEVTVQITLFTFPVEYQVLQIVFSDPIFEKKVRETSAILPNVVFTFGISETCQVEFWKIFF